MNIEDKALFNAKVSQILEKIEKIEDSQEKQRAKEQIEYLENRWILGAHFVDRLVQYNPTPFVLCKNIAFEVGRSLTGLFTGSLSPKQFGGPLLIMQMVKNSLHIGLIEGMFWLGTISINLALLNLLPIPVLDGGHICISIVEKIRKKRMSSQTMQRIMLPFIIIMVGLFFYLTFNDILRVFGNY